MTTSTTKSLDLSSLESLRDEMNRHFSTLTLSFDPRDKAGVDSHSYRQALTNIILQNKKDGTEGEVLKIITVLAVTGTATASSRRFGKILNLVLKILKELPEKDMYLDALIRHTGTEHFVNSSSYSSSPDYFSWNCTSHGVSKCDCQSICGENGEVKEDGTKTVDEAQFILELLGVRTSIQLALSVELKSLSLLGGNCQEKPTP